eukprot:m.321278 g.321278  ORF g.321278 m.321278 type:complete len:288 (+) comp19708_c13_seq2:116-979(+)
MGIKHIRHRRRGHIDDSACSYCQCCRGSCGGCCMRTLDWLASICAWCSVIFIIVALATSHWAVVEITFPSGNQPDIARGLFMVAVGDGEGTTVVLENYKDDPAGDLDPFCGPRTAQSVFASDLVDYMLRFAPAGVVPSTQLPQDGVLFGPTRDLDTLDWCSTRDETIGLAAATLVLAVLTSATAFCLGKRGSFLAFLILTVLAVIFGIAASAHFASWVDDAKDNKNYVALLSADSGELMLGWSFYLFTVGWLLVLAAALLDLLAWCASPALVRDDEVRDDHHGHTEV